MRPSRPLFAAATAVLLALAAPCSAESDPNDQVVDRVAAVVGHEIILVSDLKLRAKPFFQKIGKSGGSDSQRSAEQNEVMKELLDQMIDGLVEAELAARLKLAVAPAEIDRAIQELARRNGMTVAQLETEAEKQGLSGPELRTEIGRQLLEAKLLELRLLQRGVHRDPKMSDADFSAMIERERRDWLNELKRATYIDTRL